MSKQRRIPIPGQEADATAAKGQQKAEAEEVAVAQLDAGKAAGLTGLWVEVEDIVDAQRESNDEGLADLNTINAGKNVDAVDAKGREEQDEEVVERACRRIVNADDRLKNSK